MFTRTHLNNKKKNDADVWSLMAVHEQSCILYFSHATPTNHAVESVCLCKYKNIPTTDSSSNTVSHAVVIGASTGKAEAHAEFLKSRLHSHCTYCIW